MKLSPREKCSALNRILAELYALGFSASELAMFEALSLDAAYNSREESSMQSAAVDRLRRQWASPDWTTTLHAQMRKFLNRKKS